jgi:hypothetical protein
MKPLFTLPWGIAYFSRNIGDVTFRGSPEKYADALVERYGNLGAALGFIVALKAESGNKFFTQAHNVIANRLLGKKRKDRPVHVPDAPVQ